MSQALEVYKLARGGDKAHSAQNEVIWISDSEDEVAPAPPTPPATSASVSIPKQDKGKQKATDTLHEAQPPLSEASELSAELVIHFYQRLFKLGQLCKGRVNVLPIQRTLERAMTGQEGSHLPSPGKYGIPSFPPGLEIGDEDGDWAVGLYKFLLAYMPSPDESKLQEVSCPCHSFALLLMRLLYQLIAHLETGRGIYGAYKRLWPTARKALKLVAESQNRVAVMLPASVLNGSDNIESNSGDGMFEQFGACSLR